MLRKFLLLAVPVLALSAAYLALPATPARAVPVDNVQLLSESDGEDYQFVSHRHHRCHRSGHHRHHRCHRHHRHHHHHHNRI